MLGVGAVISVASGVSDGIVNTTNIVNGGTGYYVGQGLQLQQPGASGTAWFIVTSVGAGGVITAGGTGGPYIGTGYVVGATTIGFVGFLVWIITGNTPLTIQSVITAMISGINSDASITAYVTPSASIDGDSLILTAVAGGVTGNSIEVLDISANINGNLPPPFYFPASPAQNLQGGQVVSSGVAPRSFTPPASTAEVGGTIYIANIGPFILKYSGPGLFAISTMYNGVGTIRKFAGSLIGLRVIPQLGTLTQNADMIFAWSAPEALDIWNPISTAGNVTGAGFEQLADIGDYLVGLIVSNNTAFIIRSQGLSYATATGNATLPFDICHIGLGDQGEGASITNLICQYDQSGFFISNSDIYQVSNGIQSIGAKIKSLLFEFITSGNNTSQCSAGAAAINIGGDVLPIVAFVILNTTLGLQIFLYSAESQTWTQVNISTPRYLAVLVDVFFTVNQLAGSNISNPTLLMFGTQSANPLAQVPIFYQLIEGVTLVASPNDINSVTFPQEELLHGRDVTIDALYISLWGSVNQNVTLTFLFNGVVFQTFVLTPAQFNSVSGNPQQIQVNSPTNGVFTSHSPQLSIQITKGTIGSNLVRFSKIQVYGTFDPSQRPV